MDSILAVFHIICLPIASTSLGAQEHIVHMVFSRLIRSEIRAYYFYRQYDLHKMSYRSIRSITSSFPI
jgi:hypothetical protein